MAKKIIENKIKNMEKLLLTANVRKSPDILDNIIADDFIEFGSSGRVFNKKITISTLKDEKIRKLQLSDFNLKELGGDHYLATYKITEQRLKKKNRSLRSSIWVNTKNGFRLLFHQGTKIK